MKVVVSLTIIMKEIRTLYYFQLNFMKYVRTPKFFLCVFLFFRKNVNAHLMTYTTMSNREKIVNFYVINDSLITITYVIEFTYHQVVTKLDDMFKLSFNWLTQLVCRYIIQRAIIEDA